jgi:endonuclease/exonuclease/phosphatase family metal-dependent hydrolase
MSTFFRKILRILHLVLILLTVVAYMSGHTHPQDMSYVQFVGIAYPWLLLGNIVFAFVWYRLGTKYYLFSIGIIVLGWSHFCNFVGFSIINSSTKGKKIKVMTYNIDNFSRILSVANETDRLREFNDFINKENPDFICLQEAFITEKEYSQAKFKKISALVAYPYRIHPTEKAIVIFSKYPPSQSQKITITEKLRNNGNSAIVADFQIEQRKFRLLTFHLQSNSIRERTEAILENQTIRDKQTIFEVLRAVRAMSYYRAKQAAQISEFIGKSPKNLIVAGDLNDTPQSYTYRELSSQLQDAFAQKGFGLGTTYGGTIPALRIDYVFCSPDVKVLSHRILKKDFSDHYPVIAEIGLE